MRLQAYSLLTLLPLVYGVTHNFDLSIVNTVLAPDGFQRTLVFQMVRGNRTLLTYVNTELSRPMEHSRYVRYRSLTIQLTAY